MTTEARRAVADEIRMYRRVRRTFVSAGQKSLANAVSDSIQVLRNLCRRHKEFYK